MAATYTTLTEVKRILKASDNDVIRFSDSLTEVRLVGADSTRGEGNPDMGFNFDGVQTDPAFDKKLKVIIRFNSPTEFNAYQINDNLNQELLLSANELISDDYTTPDGLITIPSSCWFGTIEADDEVILKFDPHISDNNAEKYIEDAEIEIDTMLSAAMVDDYEDGETRHFDPSATNPERPVPPPIKVAAAYLAAYYLYTDTFANIYKEENEGDSYANRWKKRAEKYVHGYIENAGYAPPEAAAFPKFIDSPEWWSQSATSSVTHSKQTLTRNPTPVLSNG
jgi:hypothetical protein